MNRARNIGALLEAWQRARKYSDLEAAHQIGVPPLLFNIWKRGVPCPYAALVETKIGVPVQRVERTAGGIIRA